MTKVVGFVGSPRKGANTDVLVRAVLAGAAEAGAQTEAYYLNELDIKGCQACEACKERQHCVLEDDMQPLYKAIAEADAVVIGSPIYAAYLTGQTKLFLDRWYAFFDRELISRMPKDKRFALIVTYGDEGDDVYSAAIDSLTPIIQLTSPASIETLVFPGTKDKDSAARNPDILRRAHELGRRLVGG